jgi:hypothetical protein
MKDAAHAFFADGDDNASPNSTQRKRRNALFAHQEDEQMSTHIAKFPY